MQVSNGSLLAKSGATSAERAGAGVYRMAFTTDITNCAYLATGGQDAGSLSLDYHLYTSRTATNTVSVEIWMRRTELICLSISRSSADRLGTAPILVTNNRDEFGA